MPKRMGRAPGLLKAIEAAGSVQALAQLLSLSPARVARWGTVPAEYVAEIEAKTGVPREQLRPDVAVRFRT
jgi:DNA-binding transcriptional regulator YdaS (Cro superfamily)